MTAEDDAPTPTLLLRVKAEDERSARAKLKIFFGAAPGVGKTYAMLESARGLVQRAPTSWSAASRRTDASRPTRSCSGSRSCRAASVAYRGAHTRRVRPRGGARAQAAHLAGRRARPHQRARWPPREALAGRARAARRGHRVHTTLNVQHVESLNDVVAQITGVRVRETVPDAVLDRADEIELVDSRPTSCSRACARARCTSPSRPRAPRSTSSSAATSSRCASSRCGAPPNGSTTTCSSYRRGARDRPVWPTGGARSWCAWEPRPRPRAWSARRVAWPRACARRGLRSTWSRPAPSPRDADRPGRLEEHSGSPSRSAARSCACGATGPAR